MDYDEEEMSGRCAAILSNGKRCPNSADPGSRYCGLPAHQALVDQEGDEVAGAASDDEPVLEEDVVVDGEHQVIQEEPHADDANEGADDIAAEAAATEDPEFDPTQEDAASEGGVPVAEEVGAGLRGEPDTPSGAADSITPHDGESVTSQSEAPGTDPHPEDAEIAQDLGVAEADGEPQGAGASEPSEAAAEESA
jgi:N utilization substance protein A